MTVIFALVAGLSVSLACDSGETKSENKVAVADSKVEAPAEKTAEAAEAAEAAKHGEHAEEGEEGCIYGEDAHKEKHAEGHSCDHGDGPADAAAGHFGAPFTLASSQPLSAAVEGDAGESTVQVSGTVDSVCQKMGCWMVVKDGEAMARIMMKDHSFTVPRDSKGKAVVVEGTLATRTFNEKEVKHLAKDGGEDPAAVSGERKEYVLTATGIAIPPNS